MNIEGMKVSKYQSILINELEEKWPQGISVNIDNEIKKAPLASQQLIFQGQFIGLPWVHPIYTTFVAFVCLFLEAINPKMEQCVWLL